MRGFSLVEVIIASSIIIIIGSISVPAYKVFQERNNLETAKMTITGALRRAQILAQASKTDDNWGLHIEASQATIFKGANYPSRDSGYDENFLISTQVIPSGLSDIVFNKLTGYPQTTGIITLKHSNEMQEIRINKKGTIDF